jgi:hypothetical protein
VRGALVPFLAAIASASDHITVGAQVRQQSAVSALLQCYERLAGLVRPRLIPVGVVPADAAHWW